MLQQPNEGMDMKELVFVIQDTQRLVQSHSRLIETEDVVEPQSAVLEPITKLFGQDGIHLNVGILREDIVVGGSDSVYNPGMPPVDEMKGELVQVAHWDPASPGQLRETLHGIVHFQEIDELRGGVSRDALEDLLWFL